MNSTITYYNEHASSFIEQTISVDLRGTQDHFLSLLPRCAHILDFGCGSGRDIKYFRSKGYRAEGVDGSDEMCFRASRYTETKVRKMLFQDLTDVASFDGVWAAASVLHLSSEELPFVLQKMATATVDLGVLYLSFKYGEFEGMRSERFYNDMTERKFRRILHQVPSLTLEESWISSDVKPGFENDKWLNLLLRHHAFDTQPILFGHY